VSWDSPKPFKIASDHKAFVFALQKQKIWRPTNIAKAVYLSGDSGPSFGVNALAVKGEPFNKAEDNYGICHTNAYDYYGIPNEDDGASALTGQGQGEDDENKHFYIAEMEIWQVIT
jgi:hypothetical protein